MSAELSNWRVYIVPIVPDAHPFREAVSPLIQVKWRDSVLNYDLQRKQSGPFNPVRMYTLCYKGTPVFSASQALLPSDPGCPPRWAWETVTSNPRNAHMPEDEISLEPLAEFLQKADAYLDALHKKHKEANKAVQELLTKQGLSVSQKRT